MLTCFVPDPCFNVLISSSMPRAWTDCTFDMMQTSSTYWTDLWTSEHKKSKAYLQFHFLTLPLKFGEFPLGLSQICARLWVFANYHFRNHHQSLCNHQHHTYTILPSFLIFVCGYWGFCVFADLIFLRLVAPMGRILCQLVLFEQQHPTPLLRNLSPFFENLTSKVWNAVLRVNTEVLPRNLITSMGWDTPAQQHPLLIVLLYLEHEYFRFKVSSRWSHNQNQKIEFWICSPFASPGWYWSNFETASPGNNDLSTHYIWSFYEMRYLMTPICLSDR